MADICTSVFCPNSNVHPGRKIRINKAEQYGATWQREWSDTVTHVIVDKGLDYATVKTYLKLSELPVRALVSSMSPNELT